MSGYDAVMSAVDSEARRVARAERDAQELAERLRETSVTLLEANQSLARLPLLEFRLEQVQGECERLAAESAGLREELTRLREERARLGEDAARAWARVRAFEASHSWRLLAPLRRARAALRRG